MTDLFQNMEKFLYAVLPTMLIIHFYWAHFGLLFWVLEATAIYVVFKQTHYFEEKGQAKKGCLIVLSKVNPHDLWQVVLQCEVEANPEPSIQWTWQGTPVINGSQSGQGRAVFHITQWGLRVKTSNLTIQNAQADLGGSFQCQGFNKAGKVQSELNLGK